MEPANIERINLVTIPERATLAMPLLKSILRQAKLSNEEFIRLIQNSCSKMSSFGGCTFTVNHPGLSRGGLLALKLQRRQAGLLR